MIVRRATYKSNVRPLSRDLDRKLERIVARAAKDGARAVRVISEPTVDANATDAKTSKGVVSARVFVPGPQFWATMIDKGTLGKREIPLEQPGRRKQEWRIRRRGRTYKARRSAEAIASGGIQPQYFMVRAKRYAESRLVDYLRNGL
jgi:hypothetical protein